MQVKVLLLDDNPNMLEVSSKLLCRECPSFDIFTTTNAEEAIRQLIEQDYDAAVLDFDLGPSQISGLEVLERIRDSGISTPVIMFTGKSREEVAIRALNLGADYYLRKDAGDIRSLYAELSHHINKSVETKRIEEALRDSESRFRAIFEFSSIGMTIVGIDDTVIDVNDAYAKLVGYSREELKEMHVADYTHPDDVERDRALIDKMIEEETNHFQMEKRYFRKDGKMLWVRLTVNLVRDVQGSPDYVIGMVEDITKQKQYERDLQESESKFRAVFESTAIGVAMVHPNGTIVKANESLSKMLGYSNEELIGMNVFEITTQEDEEIERRYSEELLSGQRESYQMEKRYVRKDGSIIWGLLTVSVARNVEGEIDFTIGTVSDITEAKQVQSALTESEAKFRAVFERAGFGMTIVDLDDRLVETNPAMREMLGYSEEEMKHLQVEDFSHPDDMKRDYELAKKCLEEGIDSYQMEKRYFRKDGEMVWGRLIWSLVRDSDGKPQFAIGLVEDITEQKRTSDQLQEERARFRQYFEIVGTLIIAIDKDLKVKRINKMGCEILGYSEDEIIGKDWLECFIPEEKREEIGTYMRGLITGVAKPCRMDDGLVLTKDGQTKIIQWTDRVLKDDSGLVVGILGAGSDVTDLRDIEAALVEERDRAQKYLELAGKIILTLDPEFRVTMMNKRGCELLGLVEEDIVGKSWLEFVPEEHQDELTKYLEDFMREGYEEDIICEGYIKTSSGEVRTIVWHDKVIKDDEGKVTGLLASGDDITEKNEMLEALKSSEREFRAIFEKSLIGIARVDLHGNIFEANEALADMLGYSREELEEKNIEEFTVTEDWEYEQELSREMIEGKRDSFDIEKRFVRKDGSMIWARLRVSCQRNKQGTPEFTIGMVEDITDEKMSQELLKEERDRTERYFDIAESILLVLDDELRITKINRKGCEILGYSQDEILGKHWVEDFVGPDDKEMVQEYLEGMISGAVKPKEYGEGTVRTKNDRILTIAWRDAVISDEDGKIIGTLSSGEDITEKKQIEESLRQREEWFRGIFQESPVTINVFNAEGILVDANRACLEMFGVESVESLIGFDLFSDPNLPDLAKERLLAGETVRFESEFDFEKVKDHGLYKTNKSGTRHFDAILEPLIYGPDNELRGYIAHMTDITDRKQAEMALRESREKYRSIFNNALVGMAISSLEEGIILDCNERFAKMFGFDTPAEILDARLSTTDYYVNHEDRETLLRELKETGSSEMDMKARREDGKTIWIRAAAKLIPDKEQIDIVASDITDQKEAFDMLKRQKEELSDFAHSMSHDLKNYFFNLRGIIELAEDDGDPTYLEKASLMIQDMSELLKHSVDLADAGLIIEKREVVDMTDLVRKLAQSQVPDDIEVKLDELPVVSADKSKLRQVFQNLLDNAIRHGRPNTIEVSSYSIGRSTIVRIANDGTPIAEEDRKKLFDRGFTTKDTGHGFGLAIVKKLVEAHGWFIRFVEDEMTVFEIVIPN